MPFVGYRLRWSVLAVALILLATTVACSVNIRFAPTPRVWFTRPNMSRPSRAAC